MYYWIVYRIWKMQFEIHDRKGSLPKFVALQQLIFKFIFHPYIYQILHLHQFWMLPRTEWSSINSLCNTFFICSCKSNIYKTDNLVNLTFLIQLELYKGKPTYAGCKFYYKLSTHLRQVSNNSLFQRKLIELTKGPCSWIYEYMNDDFYTDF
jgi:hypothetical protein